ncbi:MAG: alpha/beta hydrolase [Candidatus Limnocylindrales bacterium]
MTVAVGAAVVALMAATGALLGTHDTLVIMGFDPDRAELITALLVGAIGAAVGTLVVDRRLAATLLGLAAAAALFSQTFLTETRAAMASGGDQGHFSPVGWSLTLIALVVGGLAASWAAAVVAGEVRAAVAASVSVAVAAVRARTVRGIAIWRPFLTLFLGIVVAVAVPVLGDMFNYAPDADMRVGGPAAIGLFGGGAGGAAGSPAPSAAPGGATGGGYLPGSPNPSVGPSANVSPSAGPGGPGATASAAPTSLPSGLLPPVSSGPGATSSARPWLASLPSGSGRLIAKIHLPPPWTNGADPYATLTVYLPPGYDASTRSYPVIYEVPWSFELWNRSIQFAGMLDSLIAEGRIPPVIVAFAATNGAPIPDTECVNSSDGRQQIETYLSSTVVRYMDSTFRTIPRAAARALFGFSSGAFCAPMLLLRHPDVFGQAISFSGYYQAAISSGPTLNAWRPYGGDAAAIADHSPLQLLSMLPQTTRRSLYFVASGDSAEPFYGSQFDGFGAALRANGYPYLLLPTNLGHAWGAVRTALPAALAAVAGRWVTLGVFGP